MKFYSYFDGKTQFSQIFLGCIMFLFLFLWWGRGGGDKSLWLSPVSCTTCTKKVGNWSDRNILASCVDVSKGWCIQPQLKHILSILLVHCFLAYVPYKTQMNFICLPLQESVKQTSLKIEVTHLCYCGIRHQFLPIILSVKNKAPLVLLGYWNNLKL